MCNGVHGALGYSEVIHATCLIEFWWSTRALCRDEFMSRWILCRVGKSTHALLSRWKKYTCTVVAMNFWQFELFGDWSSARPRAELVPTCVRDMRSSDLFTESWLAERFWTMSRIRDKRLENWISCFVSWKTGLFLNNFWSCNSRLVRVFPIPWNVSGWYFRY